MSDSNSWLEEIINANPHAYETLVVEGGTPELAHKLIRKASPDQWPRNSPLLAALWLWHDGLEESHKISQGCLPKT